MWCNKNSMAGTLSLPQLVLLKSLGSSVIQLYTSAEVLVAADLLDGEAFGKLRRRGYGSKLKKPKKKGLPAASAAQCELEKRGYIRNADTQKPWMLVDASRGGKDMH